MVERPERDLVPSGVGAAPLVRMEGIVKRSGPVEALKGVDLDLRQGEVLGLVGDNAAAKSTLMKVLTGVRRPDGGRIFFAGFPVEFRNPHESRALGIEMIYQDLALVPSLDVMANVFGAVDLSTVRAPAGWKPK